jgi:molybdenum cofactor biosynthesis protein B
MHQTHHYGGHAEHDVASARCFVLTVSDTRTLDTDEGGSLVEQLLRELGHSICGRNLVRDDPQAIRALVLDVVETRTADVLVITGGTGVAMRDVTPDALEPLFQRRIDGFGEAFRRLSFDALGPQAILSRAVAGIIQRTLVFALPGSPDACRLAITELIAPVIKHAVGLLHGDGHPVDLRHH